MCVIVALYDFVLMLCLMLRYMVLSFSCQVVQVVSHRTTGIMLRSRLKKELSVVASNWNWGTKEGYKKNQN